MILTLDVGHQLAAKFAAPRTPVCFMTSLGSAYETTCRRSLLSGGLIGRRSTWACRFP
jgi:hypothetical protein